MLAVSTVPIDPAHPSPGTDDGVPGAPGHPVAVAEARAATFSTRTVARWIPRAPPSPRSWARCSPVARAWQPSRTPTVAVWTGTRCGTGLVGPMQFIPGTWVRSGVDGNGDGVADPNNLFDAALTAGRYLCAGGGDLRDRSQAEQAVFRYNHSADYVSTVVTWADAYGNRVAPIQSALPLPAPQSAAPPPLAPLRTASPAVRNASPPTPAPTTTSAPSKPPTTTTPTTTKTTPAQPPTTTSTTPPPPPTTTSAAAAPDLRAFLGTWSGNGRTLTVAADGSGTFSDANHRTLSFRAASRTTPTELTVTVTASTDPTLTKNTSVVLQLDSPTVLQDQTPGASPSERVCQPYDPKTSPAACSTPS